MDNLKAQLEFAMANIQWLKEIIINKNLHDKNCHIFDVVVCECGMCSCGSKHRGFQLGRRSHVR